MGFGFPFWCYHYVPDPEIKKYYYCYYLVVYDVIDEGLMINGKGNIRRLEKKFKKEKQAYEFAKTLDRYYRIVKVEGYEYEKLKL